MSTDKTELPLRDAKGDVIDPAKLQQVQYAALPPGLLFSSADSVAMKQLGLSDSITAPCGGTIPTCAVADGKTICGCGHVHPPQFHSVNLPAIFQELANLRDRVKALESAEQPEGVADESDVDGALLFRLDTATKADSTAAEWELFEDAAAEIRRLGRQVEALRADYNIAAKATEQASGLISIPRQVAEKAQHAIHGALSCSEIGKQLKMSWITPTATGELKALVAAIEVALK